MVTIGTNRARVIVPIPRVLVLEPTDICWGWGNMLERDKETPTMGGAIPVDNPT